MQLTKAESTLLAIAVAIGAMTFKTSAASAASAASSENGPHLVCTRQPVLCDQILQAAKVAYRSNATRLEDGDEAVRAAKLGLVVSPGEASELWCDKKFIDSKLPPPKASTGGADSPPDDVGVVRNIFWQRKTNKGGRFVIMQTPWEGHGDQFDLFLLNNKIADNKVEDFVKTDTVSRNQTQMKNTPSGTIIYSSLWHAPWLFRNEKTGEFIGVDVEADWLNQKAKCMPDWAIYACDGGKAVRIGTIQFTTAKNSLELLPKNSVHALASLLDDMVGHPAPGSEGTMNQTPALRMRAEAAWAAVAARPWAAPALPMSRAETDKYLKDWSKESTANKAEYARLQVLYPKALNQLKDYYRVSLHKSEKEASSLADKALESAFCNNFRF